MPLAEFDHLLDELARHGTQTVRFTGGGEPLEHPNIREMLVLPHRYGLKTCLITNGSLLDDELDELLVQSVDHIRLSVNAGTEETRRAIHRSTIADAGLSKLHTHLHKLSILRARYFPRERHPSIWATFLILPQNLSEIARAAEDVARCGADSISFRPVYHDMYARLDPLDQQNLAKQLEAARAFHNPPRFQVFTPRRDLLTAGMLIPSDYFDQCLSCHLRTVVEAASPNRLIKVCGLYRGEEDGLLAELADQFEVAWFSTQAEVERHSHPECCETCIDVSMNVTLAAIRRVLDQVPDAVFRRGWQRQV